MRWFQFVAACFGGALLWKVPVTGSWYLRTGRLWSCLAVLGMTDYMLRVYTDYPLFGILALGCVMVAFPGLFVSIVGATFFAGDALKPRDKWQAIIGMLICLAALGVVAWSWLQGLAVGLSQGETRVYALFSQLKKSACASVYCEKGCKDSLIAPLYWEQRVGISNSAPPIIFHQGRWKLLIGGTP